MLERKPIWGTIYLAENKYREDLLKNNILKMFDHNNNHITIVYIFIEFNLMFFNWYKYISYVISLKLSGFEYYLGSSLIIKMNLENDSLTAGLIDKMFKVHCYF